MYVGANDEQLVPLVSALHVAGDEVQVRRTSIATLLREAGEHTSALATLADLEDWTHAAAAEVKAAAAIAAADTSSCTPVQAQAQTGLRASMGIVDDALLRRLLR